MVRSVFYCRKVIMKCPHYEYTMANNMDKSAAADSRVLHLKASPVKEPLPLKSQRPPAGVTTELFSHNNNNTKAVHNKENSTNKEHDWTLVEAFEDSGYLSLQNSHDNDYCDDNDNHGEEEDEHIHTKTAAPLPPSNAARHKKKTTPNNSPTKCKGRTDCNRQVSLEVASTPVDCHKRRTVAYSLSSTPSEHHNNPNLPILKFQKTVCEELAKNYRKNKSYDWSIVDKVAERHLLDRVIGGHMGQEYIDVFSCLLSRNMRSILANILALLGDMDLISCKKVSRTWRRFICEDAAVLSRCQRAEEALGESRNSTRQQGCGLTRDSVVSRMVFSCMQTLASPSTPSSSSSSSCRVNRRPAQSQKGIMPHQAYTRFNEYMQAASNLKTHESLRPCKLCGAPATHLSEVRRATCTSLNCQFDFCTYCQEKFHGSNPCRVVKSRSLFSTPKTTPILLGSARSKRGIRRL
ncbi:hypothetical protein JOQ06_020669 [Pogonophryne albipinna]|uniref:ZBR-type domain-containing protein n=1 Tax=Pogonophryne albipinna TaxID=1090488 RepID=A0AAD6BQF5_9TELE|nr:hypothetical protein JOQ06_020669 [Pogonophryne albipinna]